MRREVIANVRDAPARSLLVLIERYANGGSQAFLAFRPVTNRRRNRSELLEHFSREKRGGILDAKSFQRALGEVAQHDPSIGVEIVERQWVWRRGRDSAENKG